MDFLLKTVGDNGLLKSDQNGIEIGVYGISADVLSFVKIRPKWD